MVDRRQTTCKAGTALRTQFLGCNIDNLSMSETLERVSKCVQSSRPCRQVAVNVDLLVQAHRDPAIMALINNSDLVNVDGMPIIWASRLLGTLIKERVAGIDLFLNLAERAEVMGWRVFLLGATEEVNRDTAETLLRKHPNIVIAGRRNGYWTSKEEAAVVAMIRDARPQLLFAAISSPKKEVFLERYFKEMNVPYVMGVGGSFDVVAGITKRAPCWMQKMGLEWLYRFLQEPRRMFRRYFVEDIYFFWLLAKELKKIIFQRK